MLAVLSYRQNRFIWLLGGAGLVPFLAGAVAALNEAALLGVPGEHLFVSYSAVIASFLCGTIWANALQMKQDKFAFSLMMVSNALTLAAWLSILFSHTGLAVGLLMFLYPVIFNVERTYRSEITDGYFTMRKALTIAVVIAHAAVLIWV